MKKFTTIITICIAFTLNAQNFTGKAIYKSSSKSSVKFDTKNTQMSEKMQEEMIARLQKMNQKTFILNFDTYTSVYKQEEKLDAPNLPNASNLKVMSFGGSGVSDISFKNLKEKRLAKKTEIMGKVFLIKDKLQKYDWQLLSETKNIGMYTCYKASYTKEVEHTDISMVNGKTKEVKTMKTVVTTAWYTTQIPVSNGPGNYQGLPGLILEINDGTTTTVCTEIILNPSEKIVIEEPTKGKVVSLKKFSKIQKEKNDEMMEKFKGRNGLDLGNGINIKIGG